MAYRHVKRGTTYDIIGEGKAQVSTSPLADDDEVVVYQSREDGSIWVRRKSEFHDGRFEQFDGPRSEHVYALNGRYE